MRYVRGLRSGRNLRYPPMLAIRIVSRCGGQLQSWVSPILPVAERFLGGPELPKMRTARGMGPSVYMWGGEEWVMANGFSTYLENEILNALFRNTDATTLGASPANVFISLHTDDPGDTGANEVADTFAYARKSTSTGDAGTGANGDYNAPVVSPVNSEAQRVDNLNSIDFVAASGGDWGTIKYFGIWDSGTYGGGNLLITGDVSPDKTVLDGDQIKFTAGNLDIDVD
jgi:hypothetical protein